MVIMVIMVILAIMVTVVIMVIMVIMVISLLTNQSHFSKASIGIFTQGGVGIIGALKTWHCQKRGGGGVGPLPRIVWWI